MKGVLAICLLFALLNLAASAPSVPVWPKAFSATVFIYNVSNPAAPPEFIRWFQDIPQNVSRRDQIVTFDPKVPPAFAKVVVNGSTGLERIVYELFDGQIGCFQRTLRRHLINPDFSAFTYFGQVIINYNVLNQWNARANTSFVSYFENASTREPYRFRVFDQYGDEEIINFTEFDASPQDPALFQINGAIAAICQPFPSPISRDMFTQQKMHL